MVGERRSFHLGDFRAPSKKECARVFVVAVGGVSGTLARGGGREVGDLEKQGADSN